MVAFSVFHWIISQSVFLTEIESIHPSSKMVQNNVPLLASSPKAIIVCECHRKHVVPSCRVSIF
jgi:hypothetical protein